MKEEAQARIKGEAYRPIVTVLKTRDGVPTKVAFDGKEYALVNTDYVNGRKNKAGGKK